MFVYTPLAASGCLTELSGVGTAQIRQTARTSNPLDGFEQTRPWADEPWVSGACLGL